MNETPFNLGKQAALAGLSIHSNPYPYDSKKYEAWKDGFWEGIRSQIKDGFWAGIRSQITK